MVIPAIHEKNALKGVLRQRVGKFPLKNFIALLGFLNLFLNLHYTGIYSLLFIQSLHITCTYVSPNKLLLMKSYLELENYKYLLIMVT